MKILLLLLLASTIFVSADVVDHAIDLVGNLLNSFDWKGYQCSCDTTNCEEFLTCMNTTSCSKPLMDYKQALEDFKCEEQKVNIVRCAFDFSRHVANVGKKNKKEKTMFSSQTDKCLKEKGWKCEDVKQKRQCLLDAMGNGCNATYDIMLEGVCAGKSMKTVLETKYLAEYAKAKYLPQPEPVAPQPEPVQPVEPVNSNNNIFQQYSTVVFLSGLILAAFC